MYTAFAKCVGAALDEAELPLEEYPSFSSFFARSLRSGARPIEQHPAVFSSPCDGVIVGVGTATAGTLVQAKGNQYNLKQLFADEVLAAQLEGGDYVTIYLAPKDYHRVHSPSMGKLLGYQHIPGTLLPVSARFRRRVRGLFAQNERVVFRVQTSVGPVAIVMVAALGVGNIALRHENKESRHWRWGRETTRITFPVPISLEKGEELGAFHLGSTVVAVFPKGVVSLEETVSLGGVVRYGQALARIQTHRDQDVQGE